MSRIIEVCFSNEWLTLYGPLSDLGTESDHQDEAGNEWFTKVIRRLEAELDVETISAQGQRMFCHGWNGANTFSRKGDGFGTFDDFTDEEWNQVEAIATDVADEIVAELERLETGA